MLIIILAVAGILILLALLLWRTPFRVAQYQLRSERVTQPLRIVLVSDLHSQTAAGIGDNRKNIAQAVREQQPDLILLAGDIIDDRAPVDGAQSFLADIQGICPIYYVTGNHEYRSRKIEEFREIIRGYGIMILEDSFETITIHGNTLHLGGIDDPAKRKYEDPSYSQSDSMRDAFGEFNRLPGYRLLLSHRPERIDHYEEYAFDLVLSGHAHGGQIRIPGLFPEGLFCSGQGLFPENTGGLYEHDNLTHIVCAGASNYGIPVPRIYNPTEIVVVELGPEDTRSVP